MAPPPPPPSDLPPNSLILVTGANGFLASHLTHALLAAGHRVRGTVRSLARTAWLQRRLDALHGPDRFSRALVPDMAAPNAFDEAVRGVAAVAHVASVMGDTSGEEDQRAVVGKVVAGVGEVLGAAGKEEGVRSVVVTSSSVAAYSPGVGGEGGEVGWETWNEGAVRAVMEEGAREGLVVYSASKTEAEREVWRWVGERGVGFRVNAVLPNVNFGRSLDPENQGHPSTSAWPVELAQGKLSEGVWKNIVPQFYVDVEDTALLHVAALTRPDINNERIFAFASEFNWNTVLQALRKLYPEREFVPDREGLGHDLSRIHGRERAEQILKDMGRPGWKPLEESLRENLEDLGW